VSYAVFLDDERFPENVTWIDLPPVVWTIVRNYDEFVKTIEEKSIPTIISFDHDLCDQHYNEYALAHDKSLPSFGKIRYDLFKERTGYDCAKWLAQLCIKKNVNLPQYYIHTLNPIGRMNIFSIMESARMMLTKSQS
jgi:hypothetical protein